MSDVVFAAEPTPEERGRALEAACREIERAHRRDLVATMLLLALYCVVGLAGMSWAVASTDPRLAPVVFWGALCFANAGILLTLLEAYRRHVARERDG
ncbi:MAG: hypothetical protein K1X31_10555 [Gemmatimonadaceae bacterium]|nr:hypothetical protein [Gemmatimonadaceae bacterium]